MTDPYQVLGVEKTAPMDKIKKSYRALAKKYHPDLNPNAPEIEKKFKEITAAYDLLSDPEKRKKYDAGLIDNQGNERAPRDFYSERGSFNQDPYGASASGYDFSSIFQNEDLFSQMFNQGGDPRRSQPYAERGRDLSFVLRIGFLEAALGAKRKISLSDGKSLSVSVPAGIEEGKKLRLRGQGMKGTHGASAGDVHIEVHVEPHAYFTRKGSNIYIDVPISIKEAVEGAKIRIPTIHGPVMITAPAGTQTGQKLRLKGKGITPAEGKTPGDLYATFKIMLTNPDDGELKKFLESWTESPSPNEALSLFLKDYPSFSLGNYRFPLTTRALRATSRLQSDLIEALSKGIFGVKTPQ